MSNDIPTPDPYRKPEEPYGQETPPPAGAAYPGPGTGPYGQQPAQPYGQPGYGPAYGQPAPYAAASYGAPSQLGKPPNYLVWAILTTLLCCLPFGIVSIVHSAKVDNLWTAGRFQEAQDASNKAKKWAIASAVSSAVMVVLYIILFVVIGIAGSSSVDNSPAYDHPSYSNAQSF